MRSEELNTGNRFDNWCVIMGRTRPPTEIKEALNRSMDEGVKEILAYLAVDTSIWRNYCSFLAGKGHGRV